MSTRSPQPSPVANSNETVMFNMRSLIVGKHAVQLCVAAKPKRNWLCQFSSFFSANVTAVLSWLFCSFKIHLWCSWGFGHIWCFLEEGWRVVCGEIVLVPVLWDAKWSSFWSKRLSYFDRLNSVRWEIVRVRRLFFLFQFLTFFRDTASTNVRELKLQDFSCW